MAASSSNAPPTGSSTAVRRLRRDLQNLSRWPNPQISVQPAEANLLEWHFVLHSLPADTPYHGGCYHGKILFPPEYPHAPPSLIMITPNGRLELNQRLCLSMTDWHPESWNPAWSVETILVGLLSFFVSDVENGFGAINESEERRRQLAADSMATNARDREFCTLFPDWLPAGKAEVTDAEPPASFVSTECGTGKLAPPTDAEATRLPSSVSLQVLSFDSTASRDASPTSTNAVPLLSADGQVGEAPFPTDASAAPDLESAGDNDDTPQECWICRDADSPEPLIQPCLCRGSMSGVHASCVEQWVRHHRRTAINNAAPRCSVCGQAYSGQEQRPGFWSFVKHYFFFGAKLVLRSILLVISIVGYSLAADAKTQMPIFLRVSLIVMFSLAGVYKLVILMVSLPPAALPPHRPPPNNRYLRRFLVTDQHKLLVHIFEAYYATVILVILSVVAVTDPWPHQLALQYSLPFACAALMPIIKWLCLHFMSSSRSVSLQACVMSFGRLVCCLVACPMVMAQQLLMACHPLDAGLHAIVAISVLPLAWCLESNVALLVVWGVHSLAMMVGLAERLLVKRWQWKEGRAWPLALQLALLGAYVADFMCVFPKGIGAPHHTDLVKAAVSLLWLGLVCSLGLHVNWELCVRYYRTWQNQNGSFTLSRDGGQQGNQVAPAGQV